MRRREMGEFKRTQLQAARDVARAYRWRLMTTDRAACEELDREAREAGHSWIAPLSLPARAAEEVIESEMVPARLAEVSGIPVGTIYSWISRGLLKPVPSESGPARYATRDVLVLMSRRRVSPA